MGYRIKVDTPSNRMMDESELLSRKDQFLLFVEHNRKAVLVSIGVIVLAAVGGGVLMWMERQQNEKAWVLEGQAQALYLDRSLDDPEKSKETLSSAAELYRQILDEYPRSGPAPSALYLLGNSLMEDNDYEGAIQTYQRFLDEYGRNSVLRALVRQRLAYAYLLSGDREKALQEFSAILSAADVYNKDQVLYELAKLEESDGDTDEALVRYRALLEQFPNSPYATEASLRVQALSPEEEASASEEPDKGIAVEQKAEPEEKDGEKPEGN